MGELMARIGNQEGYYIARLRALDAAAEWVHQYYISPYFIDYYSPVRNIAIEFDERHHKTRTQTLKDIKRQSKIESDLHCKFYRYPENCPMPFWDFVERLIARSDSIE